MLVTCDKYFDKTCLYEKTKDVLENISE